MEEVIGLGLNVATRDKSVVYFVIDVVYQVAFGINFNQGQCEKAGIDGIFAEGRCWV